MTNDAEFSPLPKGWVWTNIGEISEKIQYGYTASAVSEPVGPKLLSMLERLPKTSQRIFNCTYTSLKTSLRFSRKRISRNLNNPRLLKITFHTLRHWKATMEYHQTKDILHVKELLGHRKLDTTTMYIQIAEALFQHEPEAFTVKVAKPKKR